MILSPMERRARGMRESKVEKYLVEQVKARGGVAEKYKSPGRRNVPDRLVFWPGGSTHFVECKRPGEEPNAGQLRDHERRRKMGFLVVVVDSIESVNNYLETNAP